RVSREVSLAYDTTPPTRSYASRSEAGTFARRPASWTTTMRQRSCAGRLRERGERSIHDGRVDGRVIEWASETSQAAEMAGSAGGGVRVVHRAGADGARLWRAGGAQRRGTPLARDHAGRLARWRRALPDQ